MNLSPKSLKRVRRLPHIFTKASEDLVISQARGEAYEAMAPVRAGKRKSPFTSECGYRRMLRLHHQSVQDYVWDVV